MRFSLITFWCCLVASSCVSAPPEPRAERGAPAHAPGVPHATRASPGPAASPSVAEDVAAPVVEKAPPAPGVDAPRVAAPTEPEATAPVTSPAAAAEIVRPADVPPQATASAPPRAQRPRARALTARQREARARAAFALLTPKEQREVSDALQKEAQSLATFQTSLLQYVVKTAGVDSGSWPELAQPPHFDPEKHAPAQPIARRLLPPDDPKVLAAEEMILGTIPPRELESGWVYDYVSREPRRLPGADDPARILENALLGMPPGWDYAEALVERMLDDGSHQRTLAAFERPYTDRDGGVYPGITLYDAWASQSAIEMPDVDNLGVIHEVLDDWQTWKAVVSDEEQGPLYAQVGGLFMAAYRHRGLRNALSRTYLCGTTELRDGYQPNLDRFHALWESTSSTPETLAAKLPDSDEWRLFLEEWVQIVDADDQLALKGIRRRLVLDQEGVPVRALVDRVLEEQGALRRLDEARAQGEPATR